MGPLTVSCGPCSVQENLPLGFLNLKEITAFCRHYILPQVEGAGIRVLNCRYCFGYLLTISAQKGMKSA